MQEKENTGVELSDAAENEQIIEDTSPEPTKGSKEYNFNKMRKTVDELKTDLDREKEEKEELKNELSKIQNNFRRAFVGEEKSEDDSDDEILTKRDFKQLMEKQRLQQEIDSIPSQFPDYFEAIKFVEPMIKDNPALADAIQSSRNPRLTAYQLVKNSYAYRSQTQKHDPQLVEENLSKPIPSEAIASGSGFDGSNNRPMTLSEKAEVWKMAQQYARTARA